MINFIQLGNGSALNPEMTNSSFLVKNDKQYMLVDCGYNVFTELYKNKDVLNSITHICITHMDDDHIVPLIFVICTAPSMWLKNFPNWSEYNSNLSVKYSKLPFFETVNSWQFNWYVSKISNLFDKNIIYS